ncbi:hypothetical protein M8818_000908 [Zalaria obscura]|uniref:Uncharacterized protein n=1 Tax=Zalaria obscura TaxID=2024903 RepID=A0ACC3SLS8_9PEZI
MPGSTVGDSDEEGEELLMDAIAGPNTHSNSNGSGSLKGTSSTETQLRRAHIALGEACELTLPELDSAKIGDGEWGTNRDMESTIPNATMTQERLLEGARSFVKAATTATTRATEQTMKRKRDPTPPVEEDRHSSSLPWAQSSSGDGMAPNSDDVNVGLPKEMYKPRPSRSRSAQVELEPIDYSVRPERTARIKRAKTEGGRDVGDDGKGKGKRKSALSQITEMQESQESRLESASGMAGPVSRISESQQSKTDRQPGWTQMELPTQSGNPSISPLAFMRRLTSQTRPLESQNCEAMARIENGETPRSIEQNVQATAQPPEYHSMMSQVIAALSVKPGQGTSRTDQATDLRGERAGHEQAAEAPVTTIRENQVTEGQNLTTMTPYQHSTQDRPTKQPGSMPPSPMSPLRPRTASIEPPSVIPAEKRKTDETLPPTQIPRSSPSVVIPVSKPGKGNKKSKRSVTTIYEDHVGLEATPRTPTLREQQASRKQTLRSTPEPSTEDHSMAPPAAKRGRPRKKSEAKADQQATGQTETRGQPMSPEADVVTTSTSDAYSTAEIPDVSTPIPKTVSSVEQTAERALKRKPEEKAAVEAPMEARKEASPADTCVRERTPHSPIKNASKNGNKVPLRVGLSKRQRIQPLLRIVKK